MTELQILERYLTGEETCQATLNKISTLMDKSDEKAKYASMIRCVKTCENDDFFDFCGHLRQTLGMFNGAVAVSKEMYSKIMPYRNRYGFIMLSHDSFEINIHREICPTIDDLKSIYQYEKRKRNSKSISNGAVRRYFGYQTFTSFQQKMMMYFVSNLKENQTLLACLPTGAGKSFTWQFIAVSEIYSGCLIVVVPTIALSINHERSALELFGTIDGFSKTARAYHSGQGQERKQIIYDELMENKLALLFISPEALLAKEFKEKILSASKKGLIGALIVDEAHLVVSWGMKFRPEFQLLPSLRNEMEKLSPNGIKTILLSATITDHDRNTITRLFGQRGMLEYRADELRSEFEFYAHECTSEEEREDNIRLLVDQAPRPMIIYTVTPEIAEKYKGILVKQGYNRVSVFTGKTGDTDRVRIIREWDKDNIDIIVATSAFGMGVDKADVRTIITTYIPESVSRYYQEVGRAGRDGYSALNYWLFYHGQDDKVIKHLTDTALLTEKRLSERWESLYKSSQKVPGAANKIRIRMDSIPEDMKGNLVGKQHANWNKDAVLLLYREGIIDITDLQFITPTKYEIEVVLNNIPVLENKALLETYIEGFRNEERQSIIDDKSSVYEMMRYYPDECFSTFFTKAFPYASDSCSGCPDCRKKRRVPYQMSPNIYGENLKDTVHESRIPAFENMYMENFLERGISFITYQDKLSENHVNLLTELMIRYGVECVVNKGWNNSVLDKLYSIDRANYLLLSYDEFWKIDPNWIGGLIVFFLYEDSEQIDRIFHTGNDLVAEGRPVVFIGRFDTRIKSAEKKLKELSNYNVPVENVIGGEFL